MLCNISEIEKENRGTQLFHSPYSWVLLDMGVPSENIGRSICIINLGFGLVFEVPLLHYVQSDQIKEKRLDLSR